MLLSSYIPTFCSFSPNKNPTSQHLLLKFRTCHHENLRYLKSLGIINPQTKTHKNPSPDTLTHILSTVNFLKSKGFSDHDFSRLAFLCPKLFSPDFNPSDIKPVFDFLTLDLSASPQQSCSLIIRCPHILQSNVNYCLRPTLVYLKKLGLQKLNSPTTLNAHLLNTRVEKLDEKMRFLQSVGFSYEESGRVCARLPAVFGYSIENNLRPKIEYLMRVMRRDVEEVKEFPQYFAFSLDRKIVPRHLHLRERGVRIPLKRMLLWGDQRFYAKWK